MSARKYRQRGYQDDGGTARESSNRPRYEPRKGPRGRGLGAPKTALLKCSRCGGKVSSAPSAEDVCQTCGSDLHTCINCRHFDSSAPKECRRPVETRVAAKDKRNDCAAFEPKVVQDHASGSSSGGTPADARAAFDDLFDF